MARTSSTAGSLSMTGPCVSIVFAVPKWTVQLYYWETHTKIQIWRNLIENAYVFIYTYQHDSLNRPLESPILENKEICPFCGAAPIKKHPYSDRIEQLGGEAGAMDVTGGAKAKLSPNPQKEEYFICNGCNFTYIWASMDINLILQHLQVGANIALLIRHYYGTQITLTDLLTKYRTGIVRSYHNRLNFLSAKLSKRTLYMCFNYNGKRTFATFKREGELTKTYHYKMRALEVPKI